MCLHKWGKHEHPSLTDQNIIAGNGLLLYFRTTELEIIRKKVEEVASKIVEEVRLNPNSLKREYTFKDPDGYFITVTEYRTYEG